MTDVLVTGAGPVGLLLAVELTRRGIPVRIIDRLTMPSTFSKAVGVAPRTLEILDDLGIAKKALDCGVPARFNRIFVEGREVLAVPIDGIDSPFPYFLHIIQPDTERLLAEHLAGLGVSIERGRELVRLEQDADGVRSTIRDSAGREETVESRYVVGCDGAHSTVRHQLGLPFEGEAYPFDLLLADGEFDWDVPHDGVARFYGSKGFLVAVTLPQERRFRISGPLVTFHEEAGELEIDADTIASDSHRAPPTRDEVEQFVREKSGLAVQMGKLHWTSYFRISLRQVPRYQVGRVFLAGDAAHIHPPTGGQGMNTGMQDAYNLGWKMALVLRGVAGPALLESYHAERHPVGRDVLERTHQASLKAASGRLDPESERQAAVVNAMLGVHYRGSALVGGDSSALVLPGDRAPDAELTDAATGQRRRLFDLFRGTHFTLLMTADKLDENDKRLAQTASAVQQTGVDLAIGLIAENPGPAPSGVLRDDSGDFRRRYGLPAGTAVLFRPDKFIGFIGRLEDVPVYLQRCLA